MHLKSVVPCRVVCVPQVTLLHSCPAAVGGGPSHGHVLPQCGLGGAPGPGFVQAGQPARTPAVDMLQSVRAVADLDAFRLVNLHTLSLLLCTAPFSEVTVLQVPGSWELLGAVCVCGTTLSLGWHQKQQEQ